LHEIKVAEHCENRSSDHHVKFFNGICFVKEICDSNSESEDETDSDYDLCEVSGNQMLWFIY